ncbi:MAG: phosphatidate cytidylyltransferase [Aquificaceae bacterium]|nr:phosphatidate cytidylyltransferase [Aquificaceae bacterium]
MAQFFRSREFIGLLVGFIAILVSFLPYYLFYACVFILSFLIGFEVSKVLGKDSYYPTALTFLTGSVALELGIVASLLLSLYAGWKSWHMEDMLKGMLICIYAGLLPVFLLELKSIEGYQILKLLLFVWAVDVFSYYVGKNLGRHPMAPRLSPKKTWEGLLGGAVAGLVVLLAFHGLVGFVWSMLLIPSAVMGDLFKSFIKRQVGVKDFSGVLGEHGGFTDRFDSLLFTAPVYVFLLKL